jgi:hypothetical protein
VFSYEDNFRYGDKSRSLNATPFVVVLKYTRHRKVEVTDIAVMKHNGRPLKSLWEDACLLVLPADGLKRTEGEQKASAYVVLKSNMVQTHVHIKIRKVQMLNKDLHLIDIETLVVHAARRQNLKN